MCVIKLVNIAKSKIVKDFSLTLGGNFITTVLGSVGGILAARLLGPDGRGELAAAVVWAAMLGVVVQFAIPQALTYYTAREPAQVGHIFVTALVLLTVQSVLVLTLGFVLVGAIFQHFQPGSLLTVQIYLISIPYVTLGTYLGTICQGLKRFDLFVGQRSVMASGYVFTMLTVTLLGVTDVREVVVLLLVVQASLSLAVVEVFFRLIRPEGRFSRAWTRKLLGYGFRSYWGSLSWTANSRLDQFLMSLFIGRADLGQYAVAVSYATILFPFSSALASTLFAYSSGDKASHARHRILDMLKINLVAALIGTVILGALCPLILPLLFGSSYQPAVVPAIILLVGTVFLGLSYVLSGGLRGLGRPGVVSLAELAGVVITVIGLLITVPLFGIYGAAWTSVASYALVCLVMFVFFFHRRDGDSEQVEPAAG